MGKAKTRALVAQVPSYEQCARQIRRIRPATATDHVVDRRESAALTIEVTGKHDGFGSCSSGFVLVHGQSGK